MPSNDRTNGFSLKDLDLLPSQFQEEEKKNRDKLIGDAMALRIVLRGIVRNLAPEIATHIATVLEDAIREVKRHRAVFATWPKPVLNSYLDTINECVDAFRARGQSDR